MSNTDFARRLDWEQQTDLELEDEQSLEKVEHKAFVERCRRAKVTYTKLKKYEKEVEAETSDLKVEIKDLECKLKNHQVGGRMGIFGRKVCKQKDFDKWNMQLSDKRRQLENIINRIHDKYFK
jgi:hypothetical protein